MENEVYIVVHQANEPTPSPLTGRNRSLDYFTVIQYNEGLPAYNNNSGRLHAKKTLFVNVHATNVHVVICNGVTRRLPPEMNIPVYVIYSPQISIICDN